MGKEAFNLLKSLIKTRNCNVMFDHNHIVLEPILLLQGIISRQKIND